MLEQYYTRVVVTPDRQATLRDVIAAEAKRMQSTSDKERTRCNNVLTVLDEQERNRTSSWRSPYSATSNGHIALLPRTIAD